jgi:hypothetical protein
MVYVGFGGFNKGGLICFSYTSGALRRSVSYAQIVTSLLYSSDFSLETFRKCFGNTVGG